MESDQLPVFSSLSAAYRCGKPFQLVAPYIDVKLNFSKISKEQEQLIFDALTKQTVLVWDCRTVTDLRFMTRVVEANKVLQRLNVEFPSKKDLPSRDLGKLGAALQKSNIIEFFLKKISLNTSPLLHKLYHMSTLKKLYFYSEVTSDEIEPLARAVQNPALHEFGYFNHILNPEIWPHLIPILSSHPSLSSLDIMMDLVSAPEALKQILAANASIQNLVLDVEHTIDSTSKICAGLQHNTTLESLYLVKVSTDAVDVLSKTFAHNGTKIKALRVGSTFFKENIEILTEALSTNTVLHTLDLSYCDIKGDTCQFLFAGLSRNNTLKHLKFYNGDDDEQEMEGVRALCDYLKQNTSLVVIEMNLFGITNEHCKLLADMLTVNKTLKELVLCQNLFNDQGLQSICAALKKNSTLTKLDVELNAVGLDSVTGVKELLTLNTPLESLSFTTAVSAEFCERILDGLQRNSTLCSLRVGQPDWNEPEDPSEKEKYKAMVLPVLEQNFALEKVSLWMVAGEKSTKIQQLLRRNIQIKSETKYKVVVLSHNIARSKEPTAMLPREIWLEILSAVVHPGMPPFGALVKNIFFKYV